ncbi:hypothetical protein BDN70DRAFT_846023 [Pholiota conissans]|uniref:Arrestin C-terminal-like domain-containing protein n=1 Tax=Pholiota conissans TaxID=109636 RepID=A0A9P5ZF55_9AGAR|nr:hypothetical protein BDN70DRAFT_846023 [Pholiota conissans]
MQNAESLKHILGNANSRLKSGATVTSLPFYDPQNSRPRKEKLITLEQAKSRSRVNLDIFLESDVYVQGDTMKGNIQIRIRKSLKKNRPVLISGGTVALIGFESTDSDMQRSVFYQCAAPLSETAFGLERLYTSGPDTEGFSPATEGSHLFPFALPLTPAFERGTAKGMVCAHGSVAIRYIVLVSIVLKDIASVNQSMAHFYRDCCVWPRLDPSTALASTSRPIQVTASQSLRVGGNGELKLTGSLHRLHWISGQTCFVGMKVVNGSDKFVKNASIRLLRSTRVFRVGYKFEDGACNGMITDVLHASTTTTEVAQSILDICGQGTRGHASAEGWWAGVAPGQTRSFSHHIIIPVDAVTILRGKILEVSYALQVTISVGTLLPTEVQVSLPIEIINFLSIDPPPSFVPDLTTASQSMCLSNSILKFPCRSGKGSYNGNEGYSSEDECTECSNDHGGDEADVIAARPAMNQDGIPTCFADLYYTSLEEKLDKQAERYSAYQDRDGDQGVSEFQSKNPKNTFASRVKEKRLERELEATAADIDSNEHIHHSNISKELDSEASLPSQLYTSLRSMVSSRLPSSSMHGHHSFSPRDGQKPRACEVVATQADSCPRTPQGDDTTQCSIAARSLVSSVLREGHIQHPYRKSPAPSCLLEASSETSVRRLLQVLNEPHLTINFEKSNATRSHSSSTVTFQSSTHDVGNPKRISPPSIPPAGSVKDKIRELEVLASKAATDD